MPQTNTRLLSMLFSFLGLLLLLIRSLRYSLKFIHGDQDMDMTPFLLPNLAWSEYPPSKISAYSAQAKSSLPTFIWYRGKPFDPLKDKGEDQLGRTEGENHIRSAKTVVIDALSIGSHTNLHRLEGQVASWASHPSVRYLFGTTESDDADPTCSQRLTQEDFLVISKVCHKMKWDNYPPFAYLRNMFPIRRWIRLQNKSIGWLCAQQRFPHSVGKIGRWYRREGNLPDYLFIGDDDTWYGVNQMLQYFESVDPTKPFVSSGCLVTWPIGFVNFSFPIGGCGTILNRKSLERLIRPNYCNSTAIDEHMQHVCDQIEMNMAGERLFFQDGMSVSDLMDQHATMMPYAEYMTWMNRDPGYCMLGDWVLGYYANYYRLGSAASDPSHYVHMKGLGSTYYSRTGSCLNEGREKCLQSHDKHVCHRLAPSEMQEMDALDGEKRGVSSKGNDRIPSFVWYQGLPFDPRNDTSLPPMENQDIIIDALSISSQSNIDRLQGQANSWASHPSIRYLFGTTENDDADPTCHSNLPKSKLFRISIICHVMRWNNHTVMKLLGQHFPRQLRLKTEKRTAQWLCTQQRYASSVGKVGRWYREEGNVPDYLIITNDNTYVGINETLGYLGAKDPVYPLVEAGCLEELQLGHAGFFSFPNVDFGVIWNREALKRLIQPIYCNATRHSGAFVQHVCSQIEKNMAGERPAFQNGMSISDLMARHAAMSPYLNSKRWKDPGYCMLGNWVLGYYANYYQLGILKNHSESSSNMSDNTTVPNRLAGASCPGRTRCRETGGKYLCGGLQPMEMIKMYSRK